MTLVKKIIFLISFMLLLTLGTLVWFMGKMNQQFYDFQDEVQEERQIYEDQAMKIEDDLSKGRHKVKEEIKDALKGVEGVFLRNREERAKMSKAFLEDQKKVFDKIDAFQRN